MAQLLCPVCNGLNQLNARCPQCGEDLNDQGPVQHFYGPYSAYRPIEDIKKTNGFSDMENGQCIHLTVCTLCDQEIYTAVSELTL